jgi:hypothetical protein
MKSNLLVIVTDYGRMDQNSFCLSDLEEKIDRKKYLQVWWAISKDEEEKAELIEKANKNNWEIKYLNLYP